MMSVVLSLLEMLDIGVFELLTAGEGFGMDV